MLSEGPNGEEVFTRYDPGEQRMMPQEPLWQAYEDEIFAVKTKVDTYGDGTVRKSKSESPLFAIAKAALLKDSKSRTDRMTLEQMMRGKLDKDASSRFIDEHI